MISLRLDNSQYMFRSIQPAQKRPPHNETAFPYNIECTCYFANSAAFLLIFLFCNSYATGVAMNNVA